MLLWRNVFYKVEIFKLKLFKLKIIYYRYLCLRSIREAKTSFDTFIAEMDPSIKSGTAPYQPTLTGDKIEVAIYTLPLLNFLQLLILTVQRDAADLFTDLRNKYKNELSIEPSFDDVSIFQIYIVFFLKKKTNSLIYIYLKFYHLFSC